MCISLFACNELYILCRVIYNRHATFDNPVVYLKKQNKPNNDRNKKSKLSVCIVFETLASKDIYKIDTNMFVRPNLGKCDIQFM